MYYARGLLCLFNSISQTVSAIIVLLIDHVFHLLDMRPNGYLHNTGWQASQPLVQHPMQEND